MAEKPFLQKISHLSLPVAAKFCDHLFLQNIRSFRGGYWHCRVYVLTITLSIAKFVGIGADSNEIECDHNQRNCSTRCAGLAASAKPRPGLRLLASLALGVVFARGHRRVHPLVGQAHRQPATPRSPAWQPIFAI